MTRWFHGFGTLRLLLVGCALALVVIGPFSGGPVRLEGLALFTMLIAPVAFATFVFVLPLDMVMTAIFRSDADAARRAALKRVLITEAVLLVAMLLAWISFVMRLLERP